MDYIKKKFDIIEDLRHSSYTDHKLSDILTIVMCAVLCGLDQLEQIATYAANKAKFFEEVFGINNIPSKPTFCRVLNMVDGDKAADVIIEIMKEKAGCLGDIIAVDGKAVCSTAKRGKPHRLLQILTIYLTKSGVVLGQKAIDEKTNEIPVFQEMLSYIDVSEKTITADAMHCQKETCAKIIEGGGNYVFGLKANHRIFYEDVKLFFNSEACRNEIESYQTTEKNSGRIERRICSKITDISWLEDKDQWAGLESIFSVRRIFTSKNKTTDETYYYITSLDTSPKELLGIVREH